jgi:hypothetical protein
MISERTVPGHLPNFRESGDKGYHPTVIEDWMLEKPDASDDSRETQS